MNSTWGNKFRISVFGESHGECVGVVIDGLPPGVTIDFGAIRRDLVRRAPGNDATATARREADEFEVMSGLLGGVTTGAPLMALTRNGDTRSGDYAQDIPRPGHADMTARIKYGGFADYRGGGHFSGRLTAPIVFAGAIAKQILREKHGIEISACVKQIGGETDESRWRDAILAAKADGDSVGGIIECCARNVPAGWGDPIFNGVESNIAAMMFSIPAVKGVEFGGGFALADARGSEVSDGMSVRGGDIVYLSNHNGGVLGGISSGADIVFRVAVKPTPTIAKPQRTVDLRTMTGVTHAFTGRHDPCVVPRAVPVVEAGCAICLMEYL